ncbi:MAG: hypothetical protein RL141_252 [Candidatus Parcubacteria bacterium]|jgi:dihydroorotate dehydrogenase (NAD+) catalytic subunit
MQLRGIDFGQVFCSSGARNFTGKGWPYHKWLRRLGLLSHENSTLVGKTIDLEGRPGNIKMKEDGLTPQEWFPDCVIVKPFKGVALNAVGLTNPGLDWWINHPDIRAMEKPHLGSFSPKGSTPKERFDEALLFAIKLREAINAGFFRAPFGFQLNLSCPNTKHGQDELLKEAPDLLRALQEADIPIICKFNALVLPETAAQIAEHPCCDAISATNTIPWGKHEQIDWAGLFGVKDASPESSPLARYGGGGLSGKPLLPIAEEWITKIRPLTTKPIMGGGGVLCKKDADRLRNAGADAIEIGSASMLRPWRVQPMINHINNWFAIERRP